MSENFAALSVAVKIYTDAMRRLIRRRLEEAYGAEWWQRGVLAALNTEPRVRHGRPVEDNLDAHHFPAIITAYGNRLVFRDAFAALAHPRSYLELAGEARNQYQAHSRSGDIGNEDLLRLVGVMVAILDAANLSEVQEVRAIWQSGVERIGSQLSRDAAARDVLACSVCGASVPDQVPMLRDGAMIRATRAEFAQACENRFGRVLCEAHLAEWEVGSDPTEPAAELRVANAETGLERGDFLEVIFRGVTPTEIALEDPEEKRELFARIDDEFTPPLVRSQVRAWCERLQPGQTVVANFVESWTDTEERPRMSVAAALVEKSWVALEAAMRSDDTLDGVVVGRDRSGWLVRAFYVIGTLPDAELRWRGSWSAEDRMDALRGRHLEVRVSEIRPGRARGRRALLRLAHPKRSLPVLL